MTANARYRAWDAIHDALPDRGAIRRGRLRTWWWLLVVGLVLMTGCSPVPDPIVDTWPVGPAYECEDGEGRPGWCEELMRVGLAGLDKRDPGHAAVLEAVLHVEGTYVDPKTGELTRVIRTGPCCSVLVVRLADGSTRAIGVGAPGIGPIIAVPWETLPQ